MRRVATDRSTRGLIPSGTAAMSSAYVCGLLLQAGYFVVVGRQLHASGFGFFATSLAIIATVAPFVGLGAGNLLVRDVARGGEFAEVVGRAVSSVTITGFAFFCVLFLCVLALGANGTFAHT